MDIRKMSREECMVFLRLCIQFGADENFSETPRNRLVEATSQKLFAKDREQKHSLSNAIITSANQVVKKRIDVTDKIEIAFKRAEECSSVSQITNAIKLFPYFKKNNERENLNFYEGPSDPFVIVFREPEIYGQQSKENQKLFDKKIFSENIFRTLSQTLTGKTQNICASIVSFPLNFDNEEENRALNRKLLCPFLLQYIAILQPKVVICQGGSWLDYSSKTVEKRRRILQDVLLVDFPSLDVVRHAPKRKKDIWKKILEVKILLGMEE